MLGASLKIPRRLWELIGITPRRRQEHLLYCSVEREPRSLKTNDMPLGEGSHKKAPVPLFLGQGCQKNRCPSRHATFYLRKPLKSNQPPIRQRYRDDKSIFLHNVGCLWAFGDTPHANPWRPDAHGTGQPTKMAYRTPTTLASECSHQLFGSTKF